VKGDKSLAAGQRQAALAAVQGETERAFTGVIGSQALQWYRQTDGTWLRDMNK